MGHMADWLICITCMADAYWFVFRPIWCSVPLLKTYVLAFALFQPFVQQINIVLPMNDHDFGCIFICIILLWSLYLKGYLFIFIFLTFDDCYITMNVLSLGAILLFSSIWISMLIYHVWAIWQLLVGVHSVHVVFLLGDTALNCLVSCIFVSNILLITDSNCNFNPVFQIPFFQRFPWFQISYFVLWTSVFAFFQWIIHACISLR